jgi:hypothetical protein
MNFRTPEQFFKLQPAGEEDGGSGGGGQGESTPDTDFQDSAADAAAIAEGEAALDEEGDEVDSESEDDEQPEGQDDDEEEEEEELAPAAPERSFKDPKTGNWDWQKITKAVGPELEKTFRETQAHITRVSQENATYREQVATIPQLQHRAALVDKLDQAFHTNSAQPLRRRWVLEPRAKESRILSFRRV